MQMPLAANIEFKLYLPYRQSTSDNMATWRFFVPVLIVLSASTGEHQQATPRYQLYAKPPLMVKLSFNLTSHLTMQHTAPTLPEQASLGKAASRILIQPATLLT